MERKIFSRDELIAFNEMMLGRGMPVTQDGVGYNKPDYNVCSSYYYGLSDSQFADLAKRLVKYCKTQLGIDQQAMKDTAQYYKSLVVNDDRRYSISIDVRKDGTLISFPYNETFIEIIRKQPKRRWDRETKHWIVPNDSVIKVLKLLSKAGANAKNAIEYAENHELVKNAKTAKTVINCEWHDGYINLSFIYDKVVVETIKQLDRQSRRYDGETKSWNIEPAMLSQLKDKLADRCDFIISNY